MCPNCNTGALFAATATFPPMECLTAPASYSPRAGRGWAAPVRDPGPPSDAHGGTGSRLSPVPSVSYPQHGTGGSGGKPSQGIIVCVFRHIQQKIVCTPSKLTISPNARSEASHFFEPISEKGSRSIHEHVTTGKKMAPTSVPQRVGWGLSSVYEPPDANTICNCRRSASRLSGSSVHKVR